MEKLKKTIIIQCRSGSRRLPNKILLKIDGKRIIEHLVNRLKLLGKNYEIIICSTTNKKDKIFKRISKNLNVKFYSGSEKNVLERYYLAAKKFKANTIIRLTSDCPLTDIKLLKRISDIFAKGNYDYVSNVNPPTFPDGLDIEVFNFKTLKKTYEKAKTKYEKEHVTKYMRSSDEFRKFNFYNSKDYSHLRLTLDYLEDFKLINKILKIFKNKNFDFNYIIKLYNSKRSLFNVNQMHIKKNTKKLSINQKKWELAKQLIPGGTHLFSKRPELFSPGSWPTYYVKAKGCNIWDLNKKKFSDLSYMGLGTNSLGYANKLIDDFVIQKLKQSNMSTLNSLEEIELAERLLSMHKWADMVRYTRSGGEANAVAIRIARASTKKSKVAFCGYHGWHDWYLSSNIKNSSNLNEQLMQGLKFSGVPSELKNTAFPFKYNDFEGLKKLVSKNPKIGIIKMEVERNIKPTNNFLKKVRKFCNEKKIMLIFDECTTGVRETFGGLHLKYGINPDVAIFGKALGNGYAINAILGKKEIMENAQNTFISSTFWTERSGPSAAIKTLEIMKKIKSWERLTKTGKYIKKKWKDIFLRSKLSFEVNGIDPLPSFIIKHNEWLKIKTIITQKMLEKNILATNTIYTCTDHQKKILDPYFENLDETIYKLSIQIKNDKPLDELLSGPICTSGFYRLN